MATTEQRLDALVEMVDRLNEKYTQTQVMVRELTNLNRALRSELSEYRLTVEERFRPLENNDDARQLRELRSSLDRLHGLNDRVAYAGANPDPD